jgi:hypothetical protein
MQKGLPLANPKQAGLLMSGMIWQAFGNWVGTEMNLSLVVMPSGNSQNRPANFVFNWHPGQSLAEAIQNTLNVVYPKPTYSVQVSIASNYSTSSPVPHVVKTLNDFGSFIYSLTNGLVTVALWNDNVVLVTDGTVQTKPKQLLFTELIGQPKWVQPNVMQFVTPMRSDIQVGTYLAMPKGLPYGPGIVQTAASASPSQLKYNIAFQGTFYIQSVRHVGNFRDADGTAWSTIFQAIAISNAG